MKIDWKVWLHIAEDFLFPHRCVFCGKVISYGKYVCKDCKPAVIGADACRFCALPKKYCSCRKRARFYDEIAAVYLYDETVKPGVLHYKAGGDRRMAEYMAKRMAALAKRRGFTADAVAFVPQTKQERSRRGFYLNREIASLFAKEMSLPLYEGLVKLFDTHPQKEKGFLYRRGNVAGIFDVAVPQEVANRRFLLIDDIKTSGETLDECAKMLKLYDAQAVYALVFAAAFPKKQGKEKEKNRNSEKSGNETQS